MFFIFGASSLWVGVPLPFAISTPSVEISQRNLSGDTLEIEMYFDSIEFRVLFERPEKRSFSARRRDSIVYFWVDLLDLMRSRSSCRLSRRDFNCWRLGRAVAEGVLSICARKLSGLYIKIWFLLILFYPVERVIGSFCLSRRHPNEQTLAVYRLQVH
jgi:hypothetical protein